MQTIFPDTKAESWADRPFHIAAQPAVELDGSDVPEFALLETGGPHPAALALALCFMSTLIALATLLTRIHPATRLPRAESLTELVVPLMLLEPPESPLSPKSESVRPEPLRPEPLQPEPSKDEASEANPIKTEALTNETVPRELMESPPAPVPIRPEAPKPDPIKTEPLKAEAIKAEPIPRELMESPPVSESIYPEKAAAKTDTVAAVVAKPRTSPIAIPASHVDTPAHQVAPAASAPDQLATGDAGPIHHAVPVALGELPLAQLLKEEAGLAASLAALPPDQRLALPRLSIRVNAEWFQALPQTQEKLYFSFITPQAETEVLAYSPATRSFHLELAMRPLWQIRDGDRVPALATLRGAAARHLGVPAELVGVYTWHPPVLENALRMFVLQRMEQMRVRLSSQDVVTVRLASGSAGWVMNLEPIREGESR